MKRPLHLVEDDCPTTITIALEGTLSRAGAERTRETLRTLPADVRRAHLDLSNLRLYDVAAMNAVIDSMRSWACERTGHVAISPPVDRPAP